MVKVLSIFLNEYLKIDVSMEQLGKKLFEHSNYPSLLSIVDTLKEFTKDVKTIKIDKDEVLNFKPPFLAHSNTEKGGIIIVESIKKKFVRWSSTSTKHKKESLESFKKLLSGVIIIADPAAHTKEMSKKIISGFLFKKKKSIIYTLYSVLGIIFCYIAFKNIFFPTLLFLFSVMLLGGYLSWLLILQKIRGDSDAVSCKDTSQISCNSILNSKASAFWGLQIADIGFVYFTGSALNLLLSNSLDVLVPFLSVISLLSLPYPFFSMYYQGIIFKKWCVICVIIQALLIINFLILYQFLSFPDISIYFIFQTSLLFFIALLILYYIKPILDDVFNYNEYKGFMKEVRKNPHVLTAILLSQPIVDLDTLNFEMHFGNKSATNQIIFVSNPFCHFCSIAHHKLERLLKQFPDQISLVVVFKLPKTNNEEHLQVANQIIGLYFEKGNDYALEALYSWYQNRRKNFSTWSSEFNVENNKEYDEVLKSHDYWCSSYNIRHTPTVIYNKRLLPKFIKIEDLAKVINLN